MDSLTHIALGASLGQILLGRKLGNWAMLWGAAVGTLPDLDVVIAPLVDDLGFLVHHRGITHSLAVVAASTPILAALAARWGRRRGAGFRDWAGLFGACLLTHVLLDACTTYGTPLFLPWSDMRVAGNNIFIVDPLFTLPLVAGGAASACLRRGSRARGWAAWLGVGLSCLYLGVTLANKYEAHHAFTESLARREIPVSRMMTGPTPLNSVLWYCLAESGDGYYLGYHSLLDAHRQIDWHYLPRNSQLLGELEASWPVDRLIWFSDGYYVVRREKDRLVFDVLKFGILSVDDEAEHVAFSFDIDRDKGGNVVVHVLPRRQNLDWKKTVAALWQRIKGNHQTATR